MSLDNFQFNARWSAKPQASPAPFGSALPAPIASASASGDLDWFFTLDAKNYSQYQLQNDSPATQVAFGGVVNAHVLIVSSDQPITVQLTSAFGVLQQAPCDGSLIVISQLKPVTSIALVRAPGTLTNVSVFVGEMAPT